MGAQKSNSFGTAPVFFTALSTILGAILFLRFGMAVGTIGFWGVIILILLGHVVTIPTALAISEIATNKRVEGGGEYFIISRSFGMNIGATLGIALYLSQAISVAFYIIAFTESFESVFTYVNNRFENFTLPRQAISIPAMFLLAFLILKKGANVGVKFLYIVVVILLISLGLFFFGKTVESANTLSILDADFRNAGDFFVIFAIVFPAFTGMTAGVGLSGDLKKPSRSIPLGTTMATVAGMIVYILIAYKLANSATPEQLMGKQLIMSDIAIAGFIVIPLGLAASTISSALGSILVAPRTLQALANDRSFPFKKVNYWLSRGRKSDQEPVNATLVTSVIALVIVAIGNVDIVARIISMFFMVTYGSLCLISFLNHFGSSPSYRPSFKSNWLISLIGFVASIWIMFKIDTPFAVVALVLMTILYLLINHVHKKRKGFEGIFANALFQVNRNLQVYLQKQSPRNQQKEWRPSAICISKHSFDRNSSFELLSWISYKYGFGTYLHRIEGYYSKSTTKIAKEELEKLIEKFGMDENHVYLDTIISPSYTSAIAQAIQVPGIAGMENNMIIFEYEKENPEGVVDIVDNYALVAAGNFDVCILATSRKSMIYKNGLHVWIQASDNENANMMILLAFIITGHPVWKNAPIKIFNICKEEDKESARLRLDELIVSGRLPISSKNIEIIVQDENLSPKEIINEKSNNAAITLIGFRGEKLKHDKHLLFEGYEKTGTILFVNSSSEKTIE